MLVTQDVDVSGGSSSLEQHEVPCKLSQNVYSVRVVISAEAHAHLSLWLFSTEALLISCLGDVFKSNYTFNDKQ